MGCSTSRGGETRVVGYGRAMTVSTWQYVIAAHSYTSSSAGEHIWQMKPL